jgi:cysteine desulfurase/selenocysteine lyase
VAELIYLDYAATAAVRPARVSRAVTRYIDEIGATPGRGGHRLAIEAGRVALRCRQALARLLCIPGDVGRIVFMANATQALNTALWGCVRHGDRVVVTAFDHNAVLRPAARLARERNVDVVLIAGTPDGSLDETSLMRALQGARLLSINAASNVLGTRLDVARLAALARAEGVLTVIDLAQLAGHAPFDAAAAGVDMLAITGHKGLLGPQGIGALWVRDGVALDPLLTGGTGGDSLLREMPAAFPDHLEAGTLNGPGIAGLLAGVEFLLEQSVQEIHAHTKALKRRLHEGLASVPGERVVSPPAPTGVPIVTIVAERIDPATLAARLDREHGVLTRPGLHCAPEAHRVLGTDTTGAVRFSLGHASTAGHVSAAIDAVANVLAAA